MCLNIKVKDGKGVTYLRKNPTIARRDITVYKRLYSTGKAPYRDFYYKKGFHYYQEGEPFSFIRNGSFVKVREGLHAFVSEKRASESWVGVKTVKMIIPKGSKYYRGDNGDIVSDNLIWY